MLAKPLQKHDRRHVTFFQKLDVQRLPGGCGPAIVWG
jgi:hypothetical protein